MNTNRIWAIGTVLVIGAVLGLGWLLGVSPLLAQTAEAETQRTGVEQSNVAQSAVLAQMKADYAGLDDLKAKLAKQKLSVPSEVDSDVIYSFMAGTQFGTGAVVESITTGEAQLYGVPANGEAPAAAPAAAPAPDPSAAAPDPSASPSDSASSAPDPAAPPAGVTAISGLYTVPVTITFTKVTTIDQVLSFAWALQNGPRLFLVSSIVRGTGDGVSDEATTTLTASMFVMSDPDSTPGSSAGSLSDLLLQWPVPEYKPWPASKDCGCATPNPTGTPTPGATPTPTPTPTGGATATPTPTP